MVKIENSGFYLEEFVPPETMAKYGESAIWFVDLRVVRFCVWLKGAVGGAPVTINDWVWGGQYKHSGYRPPTCDVGASESSHRRCIAVDIKVGGYTPDAIRKIIRDNFEFLNKEFGLTAIEKDTGTWTHVDFRVTLLGHLFEISYN